MQLGALDDDLLAGWRGLVDRAVEPNPFVEPGFVVPALKHLGDEDVGVAVVVRDGRMVAVAPVQRRRSWRSLPLPSVGVWMHDQLPMATPLLADRSDADELLRVVRGWAPRAALLTIEEVRGDGPVFAAMKTALTDAGRRTIVWEQSARALVDREAHADIVADLLEGNYSRLPSKRRGLERDLGGELRTVDRGDDPRAIEQLLALEAAGWKGREGTAMLSTPPTAAFFREVFASFAEAGRLQLLSLETDDGPVAMQANLVGGDTLFHYKSAFDEDHGRRSPGLLLLLDMVHQFADSELRRLDSCTDPGNTLFNDLLPERRPIVRYVVPVRAPLVTGMGVRAAARLRDRRERSAAAQETP